MFTRLAIAVSAIAVISLPSVAPAAAADDGTTTGPTAAYIVQFTPGSDRAAEVAKAKGLGMKVTFEYSTALQGMAVQANAGQLRALQANPNVRLVEADGVVTASETQSPATWGLDRADQRTLPLSGTYSYLTEAVGVTAYIIDTGINAAHEDFGTRVKPGFTSIADGLGTADCDGHGTHVAGTVGGSTYGVAKGVSLVPVRVLDCTGSGSWSGVIAGIDWVAKNAQKPAVANMSLGGGASTSVDTAVNNLVNAGVTTAVAAGNDNRNACNYSPARAATAITVGATTSADARASYSNFGTCLDVFAPGSSITSAWSTSVTATNTISGTSMASPHVAGAAALVLAANTSASPAEVASALITSSTPNKVTSAGTGSPNRLLFVDGGMAPAPAPSITSLSPTSAAVGTTVTINGSNLTGVTSVTFNGVSATFAPVSASSLTAVVPDAAVTGSVVVTSSAVVSNAVTFTVTSANTTPTVTAPSAPQNLRAASITRTAATLSWTAPSSGPVDYYEVRVGTTSAWTNFGLSTSARASNLTRNTSYTWQVRAVNSAGPGTIAQGSFRTSR